MIKLITPISLLITVALLAIYSAYAFMIGSIEKSEPLLACGVAAVVASYGTAMMRPWSQYLVYGLSAGFILKWLHSIYYAKSAGYFDLAFSSWKQILDSRYISRQGALRRGDSDCGVPVGLREPCPRRAHSAKH